MPVMMAPSQEAHGELALALGAEMRARLAQPCRVISEAGILIPDRADTYYVADLAVTCAPREPGAVWCSSPSSSSRPCRRRLARSTVGARSPIIGRCRPVKEILVVFRDERRVEVQRRTADGWRVEDLIGRAEISLSCCDHPIPLDAVYPDLLETTSGS
jgi:hypothetical protein